MTIEAAPFEQTEPIPRAAAKKPGNGKTPKTAIITRMADGLRKAGLPEGTE